MMITLKLNLIHQRNSQQQQSMKVEEERGMKRKYRFLIDFQLFYKYLRKEVTIVLFSYFQTCKTSNLTLIFGILKDTFGKGWINIFIKSQYF